MLSKCMLFLTGQRECQRYPWLVFPLQSQKVISSCFICHWLKARKLYFNVFEKLDFFYTKRGIFDWKKIPIKMSKRSKCEIYFKSGSEQKLWLTKLGKLQILYMPGRADGVKILLQLVWNERISAAAASPQCLQWFFPHAPCCHGCGCSLFHLPSPFHQQPE